MKQWHTTKSFGSPAFNSTCSKCLSFFIILITIIIDSVFVFIWVFIRPRKSHMILMRRSAKDFCGKINHLGWWLLAKLSTVWKMFNIFNFTVNFFRPWQIHVLPLQLGISPVCHLPSSSQRKVSLCLFVEVRYPSSQTISTFSPRLKTFWLSGSLVVPVGAMSRLHVISANQI